MLSSKNQQLSPKKSAVGVIIAIIRLQIIIGTAEDSVLDFV